jgi:hypothetical protein
MSNRIAEQLTCKEARKLFAPFSKNAVSDTEQRGVAQHLESCGRCAQEYRLAALYYSTLDLTAAPEVVAPDEEFFIALRARIARGAEQFAPRPVAEESWSTALLLTARQLIPAMALLLLLIFGATILWSNSSRNSGQSAQTQITEPTPYDAIDTSVIVAEERGNGR